jgi:hypothetical protein
VKRAELAFGEGIRIGSFIDQQSGLSVKQGGTADFDSSLPCAESFFVSVNRYESKEDGHWQPMILERLKKNGSNTGMRNRSIN